MLCVSVDTLRLTGIAAALRQSRELFPKLSCVAVGV